MPPQHPLHDQVSTALKSRYHLLVNTQWLNDFLASRGPNPPPLPALLSTAQFRILASDITTSLSPPSTDLLPADVGDVNVKERALSGHVIVQVLDVLDIGSSKWSQVEAIERVERGEEIRGREVIRTVDGMEDEDGSGPDPAPIATTRSAPATANANASSPAATKKLSAGPHKLVVQDARGFEVLAFELVKIPKIGLSIAASAMLPGSQNARLSSQDDPGMYIGCGKVEAWDKKWKEGRKQTLTTFASEGT
ncbi:hypothetical protein LTR10_016664 [Elasticomyces elasticus]|uniref:RecQ mediated genome instability protein 1-like N-terminal helical domain-containing protein n=1 Tax=Exophiala sideris TaxID=1016849 RepID=A0ABR0JQN3_9EURO|nr:hypothetical protein LTR10_016664 [Elasticomyces elasticus]KAK5039895.1 hypothetical protein LTS07_000390 [Exophiala sideris]KAK5041447.1 hypothetical protein LTR13_002922 [Exophiala sideris]KAK5068274.1 hypothetical protein LTR69_000392 [Exophiala sideris]KAK5187575.1 hypothetical protein LTR44_000391 [Eurotiomycetes sp. CCFEE 6388]